MLLDPEIPLTSLLSLFLLLNGMFHRALTLSLSLSQLASTPHNNLEYVIGI